MATLEPIAGQFAKAIIHAIEEHYYAFDCIREDKSLRKVRGTTISTDQILNYEYI